MVDGSRYDRLRRRIAPLAFLVALGFLIHETCERDERTQTTITLDFGAGAPGVRAVRADVFSDAGDPIAWFERATGPDASGRMSFPALLTGPATIRLRVTTATGIQAIERRLHPEGGDAIVLRLDLPGP